MTAPRAQSTQSGWLPAGLFEWAQQLADLIDARLVRPKGSAQADTALPGEEIVGDAKYWVEMALLDPNTSPAAAVKWGDGALCVDLGPDDYPTWERFAQTVAEETDVELVAQAAQQWRLAVTPYRKLAAPVFDDPALVFDDPALPLSVPMSVLPLSQSNTDIATPADIATPTDIATPVDITGAVVVDLTSMWAGPLCTQLLARAGAQVTKITTNKRPDGLAGSPMYQPLNSEKQTLELDLDQPADRHHFDQLLSAADLLVTSLSPRALANFSLVPEALAISAPKLCLLAITAFPANTPEADWIAYGTGVHATLGLGCQTETIAYSYPDPLAGLLSCAIAIDQLTDNKPSTVNQSPAGSNQHTRVSLAEAARPLVRLAQQHRTTGVASATTPSR